MQPKAQRSPSSLLIQSKQMSVPTSLPSPQVQKLSATRADCSALPGWSATDPFQKELLPACQCNLDICFSSIVGTVEELLIGQAHSCNLESIKTPGGFNQTLQSQQGLDTLAEPKRTSAVRRLVPRPPLGRFLFTSRLANTIYSGALVLGWLSGLSRHGGLVCWANKKCGSRVELQRKCSNNPGPS